MKKNKPKRKSSKPKHTIPGSVEIEKLGKRQFIPDKEDGEWFFDLKPGDVFAGRYTIKKSLPKF